jgi:hypothetical protein
MPTICLTLTIWKCNKTAQEFQVYDMAGPGWYGEFLMHAQDGRMAYWRALNDAVYQSLDSITTALAAELSLNRLTVFYRTCGICCDPAADGSLYSSIPYCPVCKDTDVSFTDIPEPLQIKTFALPSVTHKRWKGLAEAARTEVVRNEIKRVGLI